MMLHKLLPAIALAALALCLPARQSDAFLLHGTGGTNIQVTPPAVTLTRTNPSASASPSNSFVSTGESFAQGEISSGSSPKVLVNGSAVSTQIDQALYWGDGSLRWARLSYRLGSAAGHNSTVDIISSQNTPPNTTCARSTADVSAADIDAQLTGVTNIGLGTEGSGTWKARINDAITAGGIFVQQIGSGPVDCEWKFITPFKDTVGGAAHPNLYLIAYVRAWTNSDGSAGPLEYRVGIVNGWLQSTNMGLSSLQISTGTTPSTAIPAVASFTGSISGTTLTVTTGTVGTIAAGQYLQGSGILASSGLNIVSQITSAETGGALGGKGTYQVSASTTLSKEALTGAVPISFSVGTGNPYYVGQAVTAVLSAGNFISGNVQSYSAGTLVLIPTGKKGSGTASSWFMLPSPSIFTFTAALRTGGGTTTVRTISNISVAHNSGAWLSGNDGQRDWSDSRTPFQIAIDPTYAIKSGLFPPYDTSIVSPVADASYTPACYSPMISGFVGSTNDCRNGLGYTSDANYYNGANYVTAGTNAAGDRDDIGLAPAWASRAFVNQGANHLQTERTRALVAFHFNVNRANPATNRVPVLNNGSDDAGTQFANLGANFSTTWANNDTSQMSSDLVNPAGGTNGVNGAAGPGSLVDAEHLPSLAAMEYLQSGDDEYLELTQKLANQVVFDRNPAGGRNLSYTVGGTTYTSYGLAGGQGIDVRSDAWAERELALAATLTPTSAPESAYFVKLYNDGNVGAIYNLLTVYYPSVSNYAAAFPSLGLYWFPSIPGVSGTNKTGQVHMFQQHYVMQSVAYQYMLTRNSTALALANYVYSNYAGMTGSGWGSPLYWETYYRGGYFLDETTRQTIGTFDRVGFFEAQSTVDSGVYLRATATSGSATFTLATNGGSTSTAPIIKLITNTRFRPTAEVPDSAGSSNGPSPPGNLSFGTTYYVVNPTFASVYGFDSNGLQTITSGLNTFQLALTPNGTPIQAANDNSGFNFVIENPNAVPSGEMSPGAGYNGPGSYGNLAVSALEMASYIGISGAAANLATVQAVVKTYPIAPNNPANNNKISFLSVPP